MKDEDTEGGIGEVLRTALRLGLTSFGGPTAHVGYFRTEYVERRRWLDDLRFADLLALCQFLPGPASSQLGIAIGTLRAGRLGGIAAWVGFTLPSAVALVLFGLGLGMVDPRVAGPWIHGLELAAVAVVAAAVISMARTLAFTPGTAAIALGTAAALLLLAVGPLLQVGLLAAAAAVGTAAWGREPASASASPRGGRRTAGAMLAVFALLLATLPVLRTTLGSEGLAVADAFYRTGSLVFGGGHVVLPLLESEVVGPGWVNQTEFVAGYGAAQAVPGPLFSFAAYLGAVSRQGPGGWTGAALALSAIYLPSFLLLWGVLPFWERLRSIPRVRGALRGVCAAVVGLLGAAFVDPVFRGSVHGAVDLAVALGAYVLLTVVRLPPWIVVLAAGTATGVIG